MIADDFPAALSCFIKEFIMKTWIARFPFTFLTIFLSVGVVFILFDILSLAKRINLASAEQFAEEYNYTLSTIHSIYSTEIVANVKGHGVAIDPDYNRKEGAIPPPVTFSIMLSDRLSRSANNAQVRLYSEYPWPWNAAKGSVLDASEREALKALKANPNQLYRKVIENNYGSYYHYASPLLMEQSCVDCHNSHADSPKTDWQVGDVRGVRKITVPLKTTWATVFDELGMTSLLMLGGFLGLGLLLASVLRDLRMASQEAQSVNLDLEETNTKLERFVPSEYFRFLGKKSITEVNLGDSVEKEMTILFSDIRDFTSRSEHLSPEENFKFLNIYLSSMGPIIREHGGFIDKYIGDAIMALFSNPDDAVRASIAMLRKLQLDNLESPNALPVRIGVGINTGHMLMGTIGDEDRMENTVISDSVNLASRIESLTKIYGTLLVSETTYMRMLDVSCYHARLVDRVAVRGRVIPVAIYEVFDTDSPEKIKQKENSKLYIEKAINSFQSERYQEARELFTAAHQEFGEDRLINHYLARCEELLQASKHP